MPPVFRDLSSSATGNAGKTVTLAVPASTQVGDIMVACFFMTQGGSGEFVSAPAGWTLQGVHNQNSLDRIRLYWKVVVSGDLGASYTWTWLNDSSSRVGILAVYYGSLNPTKPVFGHVFTGGFSTGPTSTGTRSTTYVDNKTTLDFHCAFNSGGDIVITPNSGTKRTELYAFYSNMALVDGATGAPTTAGTATLTGSTSNWSTARIVIAGPDPPLQPGGIASAETFGSLAVAPGIVDLVPTGIAPAQTFGDSTIQTAIVVLPAGIASDQAFENAVISSSIRLLPTPISSTETTPSPAINTQITLLPAGVVGDQGLGTPVITTTLSLSPDGVASQQTFGNALLTAGVVAVAPIGIVSGEAFGISLVRMPSMPWLDEETFNQDLRLAPKYYLRLRNNRGHIAVVRNWSRIGEAE